MIAATTAHVVVDHLLSKDGTIRATVTHEWWELTLAVIGAVAAALAAVWTLILARQTKRLAEATAVVASETSKLAQETARLAAETRDAIAVSREEIAGEDRRHMQSFQPHIAIECRTTQVQERRLTRGGSANELPQFREVTLNALDIYARNIGPGYAVNLEYSNSNIPNNNILRPALPVAFAANSEPVLIIRRKDGQETLMGWKIKYDDAFGNKFESSIADNVMEYSRYQFQRLW